MLVLVLMGGICPMAILLLGYRINQKSISDDGYMLVTMILCASSGLWRSASGQSAASARDLLPRKRRLEALLKELDGQ